MYRIKDYKKNLIKELNIAVDVIGKRFPNFKKGAISIENDENDEDFLRLFYSSGKSEYSPTQKYLKIEIIAMFFEEVLELSYSLEIADDSRPFSWRELKKFKLEKLESGGYVSSPSLNRWILINLRKREDEMKDKFSYLFEDYVRIVGTEGVTEPSKELFKIIIEGMLMKDFQKILVVEIAHTHQESSTGRISKSISFAIFDWHDWLLFPDFCNEGDSGEGGSGYFNLKKFLEDRKESNRLILWHKDIDPNEFREKIADYTPVKYKDYMPKKNNEILINIFTKNEMLDKIIEELNSCFNERLYLACGILMRKIIEESLIQKKKEISKEMSEKDIRIKGAGFLMKDLEIKKRINNSHLISNIKNIYHLESEEAVHGFSAFNLDSLKTESRIVSNLLKELFPRDIKD